MVKNRFNGFTGETSLAFNPSSRRYFELFHQEKEVFVQSNGNIRKLIESRNSKYGCIEPPLDKVVAKKAESSSEVSHLEMFKHDRPMKLRVAVQKDLEKYTQVEEPEFGNKNVHIKVLSSDDSEEMESDYELIEEINPPQVENKQLEEDL